MLMRVLLMYGGMDEIILKKGFYNVTQLFELFNVLLIGLTEFEAPKWCVPIKANVLNFEWDVGDFMML